MHRRRWLRLAIGSTAATAAAGSAGALWLAGPPAPLSRFADTAAALLWLERIVSGSSARSLTVWSLAQVLEHAAQSVEYSLDGYPTAHAPWLQASAGALAFRVFSRSGRMRHDTLEPIPGAPPLTALRVDDAAARLAQALRNFESQPASRPLAPHFAFGPLGKANYRRAHLMHLADHAAEIVSG